jgi:hypothetical protein
LEIKDTVLFGQEETEETERIFCFLCSLCSLLFKIPLFFIPFVGEPLRVRAKLFRILLEEEVRKMGSER